MSNFTVIFRDVLIAKSGTDLLAVQADKVGNYDIFELIDEYSLDEYVSQYALNKMPERCLFVADVHWGESEGWEDAREITIDAELSNIRYIETALFRTTKDQQK